MVYHIADLTTESKQYMWQADIVGGTECCVEELFAYNHEISSQRLRCGACGSITLYLVGQRGVESVGQVVVDVCLFAD